MPKTQDEELVSALDQPIRFDPKPILDDIDSFYAHQKELGDIEVILDRAKQYITNFRMSGLALAKLLYLMKKDWADFDIGDNFEDTIYDVLGITKATVSRYIAVWSIFADQYAPAGVSNKLLTKPMKSLVPMGKAVEQGYEIQDNEWEELANAPDDATIRGILRGIKGQEPRKSGITIYVKRNGDLVAYNEGTAYGIGYLEVSDTLPVVQKAIERIISGAGITRE